MKTLDLSEEWEDGALYKVILVQQELPIFAEYDYSAQWDLIVKALEMDYEQERLFSFVHPKNGKKVYMRKYTKCPANGNAELAVGTMVKPLDFARAIIVLNSHMYKVPYIVLERYRHISSNPNVMAKMIERAFNPNRSLGPISSCDVKVFSCSPESKECLPLIHGPHKM